MNKKNIIIIVSVLVFIMIVGGISYSYFVYNKDVGDISLTAGEISITLSGVNGNQTFSNMIPMTDYEGMNSNSYFDFTVNGTVDTERIYYEVYILPDSGNTLDTSYLKTYLTDQSNNELNGVTIFNDLYESEVENGKVLYKGIVEVNNNGTPRTETKDFRLRLWLDESYAPQTSKVFDFDVYLYAKNVDANFYIPTFRNMIEHNVSQTYIASYADLVASNPDYSTFTTQDTVGVNNNKQIVYYYTGSDAKTNANVLFAGYCWQIIRTTDNGGVRMIYNGVAVNNKCETTREVTKGINADGNGTTQTMSAASLYGRSYDYNLTTGEFTIEDSTSLPTSWSTSDNNGNGIVDYKELIGTYTCLSNSSTCSTLYYVGSIKQSNTAQAYVAKYTIGDVAHYSQIGTSAFNSNYYSPAMVGYMFNTEYDYNSGSKSGEYFTAATWNGTTYNLTSGNSGTAPDVEHHYICDIDCTKVRYYYYDKDYYILLENGATVEDAIYKMTGNGTPETKSKTINANYELNNYNSAMKGYLDNWYKKNLTVYTSFLDGTSVYCNDRSVRELGGWNPTNSPSLTTTLQFYQYSANRDLNCVNETDRFAVTNNKAELTYPIGLLTEPERILMTANFAKTGQIYWGASPYSFNYSPAYVRSVDTTGDYNCFHVYRSLGARGVVTLKPSTEITGGTGTYTDPYVVGPLVTRSE